MAIIGIPNTLYQVPQLPMYPTLPSTFKGPTIWVESLQSVCVWVTTAFYTGYRTLACGSLSFGTTPTPRPFEVMAVGQTLLIAEYASLYARFKESGLHVVNANWVAGNYHICDVSATQFKAPDMRNQFLRFTGTDADTANARTLGSKQGDAYKAHSHAPPESGSQVFVGFKPTGSDAIAGGSGDYTTFTNTAQSGGPETRPRNSAFTPVINL